METFSRHCEAEFGRAGRFILDIRPLPGENVRAGTHRIRSQRTGTVLQAATNAVETARYLVRENQKWIIAPAGAGFYKSTSAAGENGMAAAQEMAMIAPFTGDAASDG